jgi:ferredoxin
MYYPEDFGPLGCVGCGRCIDACPVGIDILEVVAAVEEMAG